MLLYILAVLPLWFRRPNPVIFVPADFAAIGLYLLYINFATGGHWFLTFALPVTGTIGVLVTTVVTLLRYLSRGYLYIFGGALMAGLGFAAGVAIIDSLWGDCDWGHGDIDIDVDRYNNINSNRQLNVNQNNWQHNASNRDGVPYRDRASREQYGQRLANGEQREALRGRDTARVADRERARESLAQRGFESPASSNRQARERAQSADSAMRAPSQARQQAQPRDRARSNPQARQQARQQYSSRSQGTRDNAFAGARAPSQERAYQQRGQVSRASASRPQSARASGRSVNRPAMSSSRGGARRR